MRKTLETHVRRGSVFSGCEYFVFVSPLLYRMSVLISQRIFYKILPKKSHCLYDFKKRIHVVLGCSPACAEADYGAAFVVFFKEAVEDFFAERL